MHVVPLANKRETKNPGTFRSTLTTLCPLVHLPWRAENTGNGTPDPSADNNPNDADSENYDTNGNRQNQGSDADGVGDGEGGRETGNGGDGITSAGAENVVGETKEGDSKDDNGFEITDEQLSALYGRISALRKRDVVVRVVSGCGSTASEVVVLLACAGFHFVILVWSLLHD